MNATLLGMWPTGSPDWLEARRGRLGGSEIAAVMGISPFESRFSLFYRKRGEIGPVEVTAPIEWGNRLEDAIATKYADEHPEVHVSRSGLWRNNERPWQVATPDRWLTWPDLDGVLEVKTARYDDGWGEEGTDQIPVYYRAQVLWYLDCLDLDLAHVAVLIAGSDYREYNIARNAEAEADIAEMREMAEQFIADLDADVRPDIDAHSQTYEAIKELHPDIDPGTVEVPDDMARDVIATYRAMKFTESSHRKARAELADYMGSAHYAEWRGTRIADRRARTAEGSVPYVQIARKLPDLEEVSA